MSNITTVVAEHGRPTAQPAPGKPGLTLLAWVLPA